MLGVLVYALLLLRFLCHTLVFLVVIAVLMVPKPDHRDLQLCTRQPVELVHYVSGHHHFV